MRSDLTFSLPEGAFNMRAGAVILHEDKILLVNNGIHYYSVGGRVRLHETTAQTAEREALEETGFAFEADRLLWICENFFTLQGGHSAYAGRRFHEVSFFYLMKPNPAAVITDSAMLDNKEEWLEWVPISDLSRHTVYPLFFQEKLHRLPDSPEHIVIIEPPGEQ